MNKILPFGLLGLGIALIICGLNDTNSFTSDFSRFFTGSPTDKALLQLIGGIAAAAIGLTLTLRTSKRN